LYTLSVVRGGEVLWGLATAAAAQPPLTVGRGIHLLGLSLCIGEVHHQDPLRLECALILWQCVQLDHGSGLLAVELASPGHCLLLGGGLLSMCL
jgi:hypothetical protein